jgi:hypothetical protein
MPTSWADRLRSATAEAEVIETVRDFIAQFSPYEVARLPEVCRPPRIKDGNDITEYAFMLARHHCDDGEGVEYLVHKLRTFFSDATHRLSQILHENAQSEDDSRQSA